jgi:hypothetical protein
VEKTSPAPKHTASSDCVVCGKGLKGACACPWDAKDSFYGWPPILMNTVRAMVYGGPFPGS